MRIEKSRDYERGEKESGREIDTPKKFFLNRWRAKKHKDKPIELGLSISMDDF